MPVEDPAALARDYLAKHNVEKIFENMQSHILIQRPTNVREFIIEHLTRIKNDEEGVFDAELVPKQLPAIFEEKDIRTMFGQFDINRTGSISAAQCTKALQNMGVEPSEVPDGLGDAPLDEAKFVQVASACMAAKTAL